MSHMSDFSEISLSVKLILDTYFKSWLENRLQTHREKYQTMHQILENALKTNYESDADKPHLPFLWEHLQTFHKEIIDWCQSGLFDKRDTDSLIKSWGVTFQQSLKKFPEMIHIPQNLINNEKIIELSFRIARAQMKEGFKSFRRLLKAYVLDIRFEFPFASEMTKLVLNELIRKKLITIQDLNFQSAGFPV